jgi:hypothetical protein
MEENNYELADKVVRTQQVLYGSGLTGSDAMSEARRLYGLK